MREIKFRAWDKKRNIMHTKLLSVDFGFLSHNNVYLDGQDYLLNQGEYDLHQYTGLKDKNGVEIYEGDILKPTDQSAKKHNRKVEYVEGSFCYSLEGHLKPRYYSNLTQGKCNLFEVIGNIYENPELLKSAA